MLVDTREAFHELCIQTGREVLISKMEADREALCGRKGRYQSERQAWRGGSPASRVKLGGRPIDMPPLRARSDQGELGLSSF